MTTDPRDVLAQRAAMAPAPGIRPGVSSYFTAPTGTLDPNLFEGDRMLSAVREWIASTGYGYLNSKYKGAHTWATIWVAGSGATYQWSAARSPGDLDVLIGVRPRVFKQHNPGYAGLSDTMVADEITANLRLDLWPRTALQSIGTGTYEVTWYVNKGAEDIRDINPYAAYDVTHDRWTVRPPELPGDWGGRYFDPTWWAQINTEKKRANEIIQDFLGARAAYLNATNDAHRVNAAQEMTYSAVLGRVLFDDIHEGRREAFSRTGQGYADWHNFRWQAHKRNGVVPALHALADLQKDAVSQSETEIYGHPLASTEQAMATASMLHQHLSSLDVR